jgi:hypothetical protein
MSRTAILDSGGTISLASVLITAKVRIRSPEDGAFQFSQIPPMPNGLPSFLEPMGNETPAQRVE